MPHYPEKINNFSKDEIRNILNYITTVNVERKLCSVERGVKSVVGGGFLLL